MRFLIDECLHTSLVHVAHAEGYLADHVNYLSLGGLKDWQLLPVIREREFTFVTNNGADFIALFGKEPLHPGIIIVVPNVTPVLQRELFKAALDHIGAIAEVKPAFICFTGDIVYNGYDAGDWKVWDSETSVWRNKTIPIYPALGNHDLHGDQNIALGNYFQRFPELKNSRYYSVRTANALILVLDSSLEEISGPEGQWLAEKLDQK